MVRNQRDWEVFPRAAQASKASADTEQSLIQATPARLSLLVQDSSAE